MPAAQASKLRSIPYPFAKADEGTSVEIFHGAHGRFETQSPVRTFTSYEIGGEQRQFEAAFHEAKWRGRWEGLWLGRRWGELRQLRRCDSGEQHSKAA